MMMLNNHIHAGCLFVAMWLVFLPLPVAAITLVEQVDIFSPDVLSAPTTDQTLYGTLQDFPHTFSFVVSTETPVRYTLATRSDGEPVSLLLVKEARRGVDEVVRQNGQAVNWEATRDRRLGLALQAAPALTATLQPGRYRLEVSNPLNQGQYQLAIGEGSGGGYWASVRDTFVVHNFYGHWASALFTTRVLVLWSIVLLCGYLVYRLLRRV